MAFACVFCSQPRPNAGYGAAWGVESPLRRPGRHQLRDQCGQAHCVVNGLLRRVDAIPRKASDEDRRLKKEALAVVGSDS